MGALRRRGEALVKAAQNAVERRVAASHEDVVLQQSRTMVRTLTWILVGMSAASLAWLALAQTEEVVNAPGKLEPIGDVKTIQVPVGGVLDEVLVKEGQRVTKGQVLARLDNDTTLDRALSVDKGIAAKQEQLRLKQVEMQRYLSLNSTEQSVLRQSLQVESDILNRLASLRKDGASPELQYLQQRSKVREVQGELAKSIADRQRQVAILEQSVEQLRSELAELLSKRTELKVDLRYQDLRAPVDGLVFDLKPTGPGFVAQGSEPIMKIVPFNKLQAKVEIDSSKIGFVRVGRPAEISIDSFPSSDFGVLHGTVTRIGSDALAPDQLHQTYRYPADIQLASQQLKLHSGRALPLQVGMSLNANIKLRKVTYLQLLLGEFKDKSESLREL